MSNSKQIDYNKKNGYRYTTVRSNFGNYFHTKNLSSKPTQEMIRFNKFLVQLCKENGIDNVYEYSGEDRTELYKLNDALSRKLTKAGIEYKDLWRSKKKFKFDKDGNVIDTWSGKIVRKREQNEKRTKKNESPSDIFRELFGDIPEKSGLILEDVDEKTCRVHTKEGDSFDFEVHSF